MVNYRVGFTDEKTKRAFEKLKDAENPEKDLYRFIDRALNDLKKDPFCGTHLSRRMLPKDYKQKGAVNLWKYDLPNAWRILYHIQASNVYVDAIVLDWFDHKDYEKKLKYKVK